MVTRTITLLDPTSKARDRKFKMASRPSNLEGKVIGFLWNSKPNGDLLLLRIKEQLSQRFHLSRTNWQEKPTSTVSASADTIEELTRTSALVINALGD